MPEIGKTYRTKCGRGRVSYYPWDNFGTEPNRPDSKPWQAVMDGTVLNCFAFAESGLYFLQRKGCAIDWEAFKNG